MIWTGREIQTQSMLRMGSNPVHVIGPFLQHSRPQFWIWILLPSTTQYVYIKQLMEPCYYCQTMRDIPACNQSQNMHRLRRKFVQFKSGC